MNAHKAKRTPFSFHAPLGAPQTIKMLLDGMLPYYRLGHVCEIPRSCRRDVGRHGAFDPRGLVQAREPVRRSLYRRSRMEIGQLVRVGLILLIVGSGALFLDERDDSAEEGLVGYEAGADDADGLLDCAPH